MKDESFVYTACPGWGDHEYCAIKTIVDDGKIVRTEKIKYTGNQADDGFICQKGLMSCRQPYNPDRLKWPLKRVGERGEGKWERVTWDQALDEIAEKMLTIREKYGSKSLALWNYTAGIPPSMGLETTLAARFQSVWGATDPTVAMGVDNGPLYACQYIFGEPSLCFYCDPKSFRQSDYLIVWGANPIENQMRIARELVKAQSRGVKIVDVGLVFDGTAGMADWFLPVKAGSDPILALGLANVIVENEWYDVDYLLSETNMPFLLRKDTGKLMRNNNDGFYVWDLDKEAPVATTVNQKSVDAGRIALEGSYTVDGVACETVFTGYRKHLAQYTLELVSETTGLPASDIEKLASEYSHAGKAYIVGALGLRYQNQSESYRAMYLLGLLTGNIGVEGGGVTSEFLPASTAIGFNDFPLLHPDGIDRGSFIANRDFFRQVKTGDPFPIKGLIVTSGNPVHQFPNRGRWINDTLPYLDLVVDIDVWMTDTGEYADYVLPDCMPFEREDIVYAANYGHIVLQEPAIQPPDEQKDPSWYFSELAKRVGLGEYFDKDAAGWLKLRIDSSQELPWFAGLDEPITYERLKKEKMIRVSFDDEIPFDPFRLYESYPTQSGRAECFSEDLVAIGYGFSKYTPPLEAPMVQANERFPYQFFTGRQRFFMQSMFTDDPVMKELSGKEPAIRMNPIDAKKEGFVDGDRVETYNDRGHMVTKLRIDEAVPPGMVHAWFGWRRKHYDIGMYSELLVNMGGDEATGELGEWWWNDFKSKFPVSSLLTGSVAIIAGTFDTLWDCACAVRKFEDKGGVR